MSKRNGTPFYISLKENTRNFLFWNGKPDLSFQTASVLHEKKNYSWSFEWIHLCVFIWWYDVTSLHIATWIIMKPANSGTPSNTIYRIEQKFTFFFDIISMPYVKSVKISENDIYFRFSSWESHIGSIVSVLLLFNKLN